MTMKHLAVMHWLSCCAVGTVGHRQKGAMFYMTLLSVAEVIG